MSKPNTLPAPTEEKKPLTLRERIDAMTPEFKKALPGHIRPELFVRTVQTAVQMNPQIVKACQTQGGMQSLLAACTKAATDGLILDGREAALVTFNQNVKQRRSDPDKYEERVQYIPMVAGLMKKARNSGEIASFAAHVVYENDKFTYVLGDDERIDHSPLLVGDRGEPVAVYAIVKLKDGSVQREVMNRIQVQAIAAQSKNPTQYDTKTGKNYGEWWRKTVIRRISKYLPSSSDKDDFMRAVERIDDDFDFEATNGGETVPAAPSGRKQRGGAAAALKDVTPKQAAPAEPEDRTGNDTPHDPDTGEIIDIEPNEQTGEDEAPQPGDDI